MSKTWHKLPSEILAIRDEVAAYYLDCAVFLFGISYEADLDQASSAAKSDAARRMAMDHVRERWLNDDLADPVNDLNEFEIVPSDEYVDPADKFKR